MSIHGTEKYQSTGSFKPKVPDYDTKGCLYWILAFVLIVTIVFIVGYYSELG